MFLNKAEKIPAWRYRINEIVEVGAARDHVSRGYDILSTLLLLINLTVSILLTFGEVEARCGGALQQVEGVTVAFFALDFLLRLISIRSQHPERTEGQAALRYVFSFYGLVDLVSFLPYYLPFFMPAGMAVFRMFRVIRIFRLFRLNAYYDSLNVIMEVLSKKKQQLLSSVFIILILMLFSSMCMYSLEHEAQPEVFSNAFSGIWWTVSTMLTVGYGDIYPITPMGQAFSIVLTFLGVGMIAIPTGIISAGFVEQYSRLQELGTVMDGENMSFARVRLEDKDSWVGKTPEELNLPKNLLVVLVLRRGEILIPRGDLRLEKEDTLVLGGESLKDSLPLEFRETHVTQDHEWNGQKIRDLDISRQTFLVMVRRGDETVVPKGDTTLYTNDVVISYHKRSL